MIFYHQDLYEAAFSALKEELAKEGIVDYPPGFKIIADWEFAEVTIADIPIRLCCMFL